MLRIPIQERPGWREQANEFGFKFHTMYGQAYWDESAYYQFSLSQIEDGIEDPTAELHQMCLQVVDRVVNDEELLHRFCIPELFWDAIRASWLEGEPSLYSRLDFAFDGIQPAKLYENNADTPTSLYESGFWQWLWLEDNVNRGRLHRNCDQFNSLQEKLVRRFSEIFQYYCSGREYPPYFYFSCVKDTDEDRGTVQYLEDCAVESGIPTQFIHIEDVGVDAGGAFTDLDDQVIELMFKLYPWEFMLREEYAPAITQSGAKFVEPLWKSVLSNKALLPQLWSMFPGHPNLLPSYFEDQLHRATESKLVRKPIFSREGANVAMLSEGKLDQGTPGPYGEEGFIYQAYYPLPRFGHNFTLVGSWLVDDVPAGISVREDQQWVTQDLSRYLPHVILG
ncbi:glutathionylspermidine synthase family protein [Oleiphilus messinensis]|nr:glutathionylspermidine synthase family protein [Oleiphilus messinensis]